jgi:hypothetical protein
MAQAPELRVRRGSELFDAAIKAWSGNFRVLLPFAAAIMLPFQLISAYLLIAVKPSFADTINAWNADLQAQAESASPKLEFPTFTNAQIGALVATVVLTVISGVVLSAALTSVVGRIVLGEPIDTKAAIKTAFRNLPRLLATSFLVLLVISVVLAVAVVPAAITGQTVFLLLLFPVSIIAIWLSVKLILAGQAVILEGVGPIDAMRRSFKLVTGRWWPVLGILVASGLLVGIAQNILGGLFNVALKSLGGNNAAFEFIWSAISGTISAAVFTPLSSAIAVFLYFDLRVRKEGFDLQRLSEDFSRTSLS